MPRRGLTPVSTASQPEDHEARGLGALVRNPAGRSRAGPETGPPRPCRAILQVGNLANRAIRGSPTPGFRHCRGAGLPRVPFGLSGRSCRPSGVAEPEHSCKSGVPGRIAHLSAPPCGGRCPCATQRSVPGCLRSAWTKTSGARKRRNGLRGQCSATMILRAHSATRAKP